MLRGGSIHKANGGYIILNAMDVLKNIFVYDALKRMIRTREVKVEDVWEQYKLISTTTLKPEPVPVDIKIVLIGEPYIYYLLYRMDREYRKLFKVKADFDNIMENSEDNVDSYAGFIASTCAGKELLPFDKTGVGAVVEHGVKLSGSCEKLSANFGAVEDVIVEASYWAGVEDRDVVTGPDVERAVEERKHRSSKIEDRIRELIENDTLMISTEGTTVGQINGMAVLSLGDYAFGKPSKVTVKTFMGDSGLVSIEREVKLSGKLHNKGQMIVKSFLGDRFARDFPIAVSASICFEQLYDEIEGDSATCAEVYALMSSLSELPIAQGIAVTGSMNQHGEVQPIGGVNEKIEGFFDVCVAKGLTGKQGVIIPKRNVRNLMLKKAVCAAVEEGKFFVYPIETVDEGLEILMGKAAGERDAKGIFPKGTVNRLVGDKLKELATGLKAFGKPKPKKHKAAVKDTKTTTAKKDKKK
jgi:lon-related putative ATP-dependent protease